MSVFDINESNLGKTSFTHDVYDSSLLFKIPRSENRINYGINNSGLPFMGYDVWNCYEVSFLTQNGLPVSRMMKMIYSCDSEFLVESKSLKMYLNSFNMERFDASVSDAENTVKNLIASDLSKLLTTAVQVIFFTQASEALVAFQDLNQKQLVDLVPPETLQSMQFLNFRENPELLTCRKTDTLCDYSFRSDLLRSNCRVTNQPDWGDLYLRMSTTNIIDYATFIAYLVSFRKENHFHEEVVEMIYKRCWDLFNPTALVVAAMYTRRGGIDINPIRASTPA